MTVEANMDPFEYPNTLVEKKKLLTREATRKNEALVSSHTSLSKLEAALLAIIDVVFVFHFTYISCLHSFGRDNLPCM